MPPDNAAWSLYRYVGSIHLNLLSPVGEALSLPLRRSRLGSLSEGAVSPNGLTEGVYPIGCCNPMVSAAPCRVDEYVAPAQAPRRGALCCGRILSAPTGVRYICGGIRSEKMPPAHRRSEPMRWGTECFIWGHQRLYLPFLPFFLPLLAVFTSSAPVASMARIITTISTPKMLLPSVA